MGAVLSLRDPVDGEMLRCAVEEMRARFPYFYVKPAYRGDGLITVPNDLPMTVRNTWEPIRFHSEASNYHLGAWKCQDRRVAFVRHLNRSPSRSGPGSSAGLTGFSQIPSRKKESDTVCEKNNN